MGEELSQDLSFTNPVPEVGMSAAPTFTNPLPVGTSMQPVLSPADGLITLRSMQTLDSSSANLSQMLSSRTTLSFHAGYVYDRFQDKNLFGNDQYLLGAAISYRATPRTTLGVNYQAWRMDLSSVSDRTTYQEVELAITKQIGQRSVLTIQGGPTLIDLRGQETITLPSLLANLLGKTSLNRTSSQSVLGWVGGATLDSNIQSLGLSLGYSRSISGSGGLGGSAISQVASLSVRREFRQRTTILVGLSYLHSQLLGIFNPIQLDQEGLTGSLTRKISRDVDCGLFFMYAKVLQGFQGNTLLDHNQAGVRLTYNFHRLTLPLGM